LISLQGDAMKKDLFEDWELLRRVGAGNIDAREELAMRLYAHWQLRCEIFRAVLRHKGTAHEDDVLVVLPRVYLYIVANAAAWYKRGMQAKRRSWWGLVKANIDSLVQREFAERPPDALVERLVDHFGGIGASRIPYELLARAHEAFREHAARLGLELPEGRGAAHARMIRARIERIFETVADRPPAWREIDGLLADVKIVEENEQLVDFIRRRLVRRIIACPAQCRTNDDRLDRKWLRREIGLLVAEWRSVRPADAPPPDIPYEFTERSGHQEKDEKDDSDAAPRVRITSTDEPSAALCTSGEVNEKSIHVDGDLLRVWMLRRTDEKGSVRLIAWRVPYHGSPSVVKEVVLSRDENYSPDRAWWSVSVSISELAPAELIGARAKLAWEVQWLPSKP
jgi:hypothetical protein